MESLKDKGIIGKQMKSHRFDIYIKLNLTMEEKVKEYVLKHYPNMFKDKPIIVTEGDVCYYITTGPDKSPLILGKNITN